MKNSCRVIGYDLVRTIAIFMVVAIHSNVIYLESNQGNIGWIIVMEMTALCLMSVPLFFMISGALLLDCNQEVGICELFSKRLPKQFIPFILWSLIYVFSRIAMGRVPLSIQPFIKLLYEPAYYQFWFMYTLLGIYLLLPILQVLVRYLNQKQMEYMLIIWFIFSVVIPGISYFVKEFRISEHIDLVLCEGYIGYFLLGFYLKKYRKNVTIRLSLFLSGLGIFITGVAAYLEWLFCVNFEKKYFGYVYQVYLLPGVVITVIGIFLICQKMDISHSNIFSKAIIKMSELSIGVFYVHMLILIVLERIGLSGEKSIFILTMKTVLIYVMSLLVSYIISGLSVLRSALLGKRN